jgi:hypothetical protein
MSASRGLALTTLLALLLALLSAFFAWRAVGHEAGPRTRDGAFRTEDAGRARALVKRLVGGLLALQRPDGGFDLGTDSEFSYLIERVAASSLATAALVRVQQLSPDVAVPGLEEAIARGLAYVKKQQSDAGAVGIEEPGDRWSQVDATSAALLALTLAERPDDEDARVGAARALRRFARAGLRNGWTRALGIMTVDRVANLGRDDLFDGNPRGLADIRDLKQAREGPPQTSDWNVAEGIARVVLGLRKGADPFPARLTLAILDDPPVWSGQSADCQAFWMQAWLVARSGSSQARDWFRDLLDALETEAVEDDNTIHGGWYANTLSQTAGALLALVEGLTSQVLVVEGVGAAVRDAEKADGADAKR